jgi:hypothetical protein
MLMIRLALIAALLVPLVAHAQPAPPDPPTWTLPTPIVTAVLQYLAQRPWVEANPLIGAVQQCLGVQTPNAQGAIVSHGECPAVSQALAAQQAVAGELAAAKAKAATPAPAPEALKP